MKKIHYVLFALNLFAACSQNPVLTVDGGKIQGVEADIKGVYVYKGIPYAAPPLGIFRWREPQSVIPWEGVKLCDKFGHPGYQSPHYPGRYVTEWGYGDEPTYSEDCLYLNVWTKAPGQVERKLPVAVFIHGGGYCAGWSSEPELDGQEWANKDVVLVSINYRLGVFGFLAYPDLSKESHHGVSGNYGILDQIAALKWVKNNIVQFGGDPDNVMIFGNSAGGGCVKVLCTSPLASGLFNKAVIMSSGGLDKNLADSANEYGMPSMKEAEQRCKNVLDWAGLTNLRKMRDAPTDVLHSLSTIKTMAENPTMDRINWGMVYDKGITCSPIIDGYVILRGFDEAALTDNIPHIPYMLGFTMNDKSGLFKGLDDFCLNREELGGVAYVYEFARALPDDGSRPNVLKGAFHSSDLWYVFKSLKHCWRPWTKGDWALSEKMLQAWTDFAKTGEPGKDWKPYTRSNPEYMIFKLDSDGREASAPGLPIN